MSGHHTTVQRTLNFYLDETHSELSAEGTDDKNESLTVHRTQVYSDTEIWAEIETGPGAVTMFFGRSYKWQSRDH